MGVLWTLMILLTDLGCELHNNAFGGLAPLNPLGYDMIRYDARCYFNVRSKVDISQLNLPHGTDN